MSQVNQGLWFFLIIASGFSIIWLFDAAYRKFRFRFDPTKKYRQKIAEQTGLKMVPRRGDPFALQGSIGNRWATVFTKPVWLWRRRIDTYEIGIENPEKLELSLQSRNIPPTFAKFANMPATNLDPSEKLFFEQFEIYDKSAASALKIAENETLREILLKLSQYTKAIKFTIRNDRIVCYESEFRMTSSDADEVIIACLIFDILIGMAYLVDSWPPETVQ